MYNKRIFLIEKNVKDNFFRLGGRNVLNLYDLPTNISGVLLLLTGMLFIKWKKHLKWKFTTMGFFSFYAGWIYNEFFALPLNVFGSCYNKAPIEEFAEKAEDCVYPFGFDPKWFRSSNELNYFNSFKMKFAVIIGVLQMSFGTFILTFRNFLENDQHCPLQIIH